MELMLRILREEHNWTQTEVAQKLTVTQTCYSKYETGTSHIPTTILIQLAEIYQTNIDYLLGLTDERKPYPKRKHK